MAESALQLRAYDPEAMASTTVPTTGDANSTVFSKIRSQALLQAAERRSQDKAKMTASNATPAAGSSVGNMNAPATRATGRKGKAFTKWKPRPMIKSAPEDYVIVIKPRERVSLHEAFTETGYGTAISAYLGPERARATSVLPSRDQNIIIVHTLDIEAADRLIGDVAVNTEKGAVPLHGYLRQDGGNTCHGVIVVRNTDTTETLQHRVCWRAGTIVEIRKFGTSNKARITFAGKEKPHYVSVQNYYKTIPACGQSAANACPNLQPNMCGLCGLHAPLVEGVRAPHNCVPRCSVCGGAHATNSRDCAAKFRTPKTAAKKSGKQKMTPKNKSRHLGQPSDQPPPHGGLEKRAAETHGKTGAWVNAVKNGRQEDCVWVTWRARVRRMRILERRNVSGAAPLAATLPGSDLALKGPVIAVLIGKFRGFGELIMLGAPRFLSRAKKVEDASSPVCRCSGLFALGVAGTTPNGFDIGLVGSLFSNGFWTLKGIGGDFLSFWNSRVETQGVDSLVVLSGW
ncbi:hypothetical protein HPB49_008074 [Dermacentor silvarum]|uniref:Uncharacterized protein n=1 Tax=Dermacentor silvarum TaxID=543639 RepID=A0ACB8CQR8_DERSI|nr:hypothetical protein HPB49_008074 [Dermacentor silvarum]